jgi:hypothetical protein
MDGLKAAAVLFVASLLQLSVLTEYSPFRTASIVLVALLSIALLRGSVFGAVAGFGTGLLIDTATLGTLGKGLLPSKFPRGIPIGSVSSWLNNDVNPFKNIQVAPLVNFSSLQSVVVLVPKH